MAGIQQGVGDLSVMPFLAPTAVVAATASLGSGTQIWDTAHVGERARLGKDCVVGRGAFVDHDVQIGSKCKIQNNALVYFPAILGSGVFVGPAASLTNDLYPRAVNSDGSLKTGADWDPKGVIVGDGASIGAQAVILGGVSLGQWVVVAAGAVVTRSVKPHALVAGVPARQIAWVGRSGRRLEERADQLLVDPVTGETFRAISDELIEVS